MSSLVPPSPSPTPAPKIWWSNSIFFILVHFAAALGVYYWPPSAVPRQTIALCIILWQLADFGCVLSLPVDRLIDSLWYSELPSVIIVCILIEHFEQTSG
jgi:hypothetical protein